jgi:hypothetical protein
MSDHGVTARSQTVIMALVTGAFSIHCVIVTGVGRALVSRLLGQGRLEPPSPLDAMWNYSVGSTITARCGDGDPVRVEPMTAVLELLLLGERVMPPK